MTIRAVLDTNVFVSAAIQRGPSHRIVQAWLERQPFELIICTSGLNEVDDVLHRPRPAKRIAASDADDFMRSIRTLADLVDDPVVNSDLDLLEWAEQTPPVVTPARFEQLLDGA